MTSSFSNSSDLLQHLDDPAPWAKILNSSSGLDLNDREVRRTRSVSESSPASTGPILLPARGHLLVLASTSSRVKTSLHAALATVWALAHHRRARPWLQWFDDARNGALRPMPFVPDVPALRSSEEFLDVVLYPTVKALDQRLRGRPFQVVVLTSATHGVPPNGVPAPRRGGPAPRGDLVVLPTGGIHPADERPQPLNGWHVHALAEIHRQVERLDLEMALRDDGGLLNAPRPRSRL